MVKGSAGVMLQLMSTMRNFLDHKDHQNLFLSHDCIPEICRAMEIFPSDSETMLHVARIFRYVRYSNGSPIWLLRIGKVSW